MPFYSRRKFQEMIDENRYFMSENAIKNIIGKLNSNKANSFSFYWEVFILNLLSKIGSVNNERNHGGSTNPDITFINDKIEFLADITAVSDHDQKKNNDYNHFISELSFFAKSRGLKYLNGFDIHVSGEVSGCSDSKKVKIFLPPKNLTKVFIREYLCEFVDFIGKNIDHPRVIKIETECVNISISYDPSRDYTTGVHLDYTSIYSLEKNPIYNSLMSKHDQLKKSGYSGIKGVFICDGDCNVLSKRYTYGSNSFSIDQIIRNFLSKKDKIDFIAVVNINQSHDYLSNTNSYSFEIRVFYEKKELSSFCQELDKQLKEALRFFEPPHRTARNSLNLLTSNNFLPGPSNFGAYKLSGDKITISLRAILELMTGSTTQADFINEHKHVINALLCELKSGRLPSSVEILKEKYEDDDWFVMDFDGSPDASITKFK